LRGAGKPLPWPKWTAAAGAMHSIMDPHPPANSFALQTGGRG
jgi:hypothetical protein